MRSIVPLALLAFASAMGPALHAQLPNCTIGFDAACPDAGPICGASFNAGAANNTCDTAFIPPCYASGTRSFRVTPTGSPVTITLSDDLLALRVFFSGQNPGDSGTMVFRDAGGAVVGMLSSNGPCNAGGMPPLQEICFPTPVRTVGVTADAGTLWIDNFEVNPPALLAGSVFRNAGANPASYTASPPVLGGTLSFTVDLSTTGHTTAIVVGFDTPVSFTLSGGQTLLCLDGSGSGELFTGSGVTLSGSPIATGSVPLPNNTSLCGISFCTQAIHVFGVTPFELSNAQDLTVGG